MDKDAIEKERKALERADILILKREELEKRALRIASTRAIHRERRQKEELEKGPPEKRDPLLRRNKDFVKNEFGLIDEEKDEQIRKEKIRQKLTHSPEIEDLQKQLQVAYIRKELQGQLEQKRLEQSRSSKSVGSEIEEIQRVVKNEADSEEALQLMEWKKKTEYRKLLQDQIINRYKLKQEEYRESLKERAVLEDALRCVMEEDQMEAFRKVMQKNKIMKEIEDFKSAKALWTLREKEAQDEEDRKIKEYNAMKEKLEDDIKRKEKQRRDDLQKNKIIVSTIMSQKQDTKANDEQAILDKYEQEEEKKAMEKEHNEFLRDKCMKKDLRESFARYNQVKEERRRIEQQEERDYVKQKLAEYQEDKKCEEMTAEKRRRLRMAYKSQVLRDIEENKYRKKLEEDEEKERIKRDLETNQERKKMINEERLRLLKQHTGQLIGYLPPGFLKPADLPHLPDQVRDFYTGKTQQPPQPCPNQ